MTKAIVIDLARVLLFPKENSYKGSLNDLYKKVKDSPGFKFSDYFLLNDGLISYLNAIKERIPLYIFTSEDIQKDPALSGLIQSTFLKIYSAKEMGIPKTDPEAYQFIAKDINLMPDQILFIDDNSSNVEAATMSGMVATKFINNSVKSMIEEVLQN